MEHETGRDHKKRRRRKKKITTFDDVPGVSKMVISTLLQKLIKAAVGENVTAEKPWIYVDKEPIQDNLELHEESSEFLPLKDKIMSYPRDQMLLVYIPQEASELDEFYICLTEKAADTVDEIIRRQQESQQRRLYNAINKKIRRWQTYGSEAEIEETTPKKGRSLLEVEVEGKYPLMPFKIKFCFRKVEDARDGYMELFRGDETVDQVFVKRIDMAIQVTPETKNNEAQTTYPFPRNQYTQYEYIISVTNQLTPQELANLKNYRETGLEELLNNINTNANIELYVNDYLKLLDGIGVFRKQGKIDHYEYISFIDVNLCKDKKVSSVCWSSMSSGVCALAYVDTSPVLFHIKKQTEDEVVKTIHERHLALVWSFNDSLSPKLILEAHREVMYLSVCPFDENIIVGGCSNGQVIIWDITNKLERVERQEILSNSQERYRAYMFSLMGWMLNIFDAAVLRPTVISDLRHSHNEAVVGIRWISPFREVTKTGKIDFTAHSLQFFTTSEDGSVAVWDLHRKPIIQAGGFKPQRRLKRLKCRPPALMAEVSPLKIFHLNLKPIYKVWIPVSNESNYISALSVFHSKKPPVYYEKLNLDIKKKFKLIHRIKYASSPYEQEEDKYNELYLGTMFGDVLTVKFEGLDFDSGEIVNSETANILAKSKYHDGPITAISRYEECNLTLTCGGKMLALWVKDWPDHPVYWRKQDVNYTFASFSKFERSIFLMCRADGKFEVWMPYNNSKSSIYIHSASSEPLTGAFTHVRHLPCVVTGITDGFGSFRLYTLSQDYKATVQDESPKMVLFLDREVKRKRSFLQWQAEWTKRHLGDIEMKKMAEALEKKEEVKEEKEEPIKKSSKLNLSYIEAEKLERENRQKKYINEMIMEKKRMDIRELTKQRKPLQILEEEREKKKRKQRARLRNADTIFQETVDMLFPEVSKPIQVPPPDPYAGGDPIEVQQSCFEAYKAVEAGAIQTMREKPFTYVFDWKTVLRVSKGRRQKLDPGTYKHRQRYALTKSERVPSQEALSTVISMAQESERDQSSNASKENIEVE